MATGKSRTTDLLDRRLHFLGKRLNTAQKAWGLIENGDRILLGLSGGKDSLSLMHLLVHWRRAAPVAFDLAALHVQVADQQGNQHRQATLTDHAATIEVPVAYATAAAPTAAPQSRRHRVRPARRYSPMTCTKMRRCRGLLS
jgi:tRNA(Ile)-lysidine synthase TilS/MesJ